MVNVDHSDDIRVIAELTEASRSYQRQFVLWLGIGSGSGIAALLSFAANLPDPDFALKALLPSLTAFAIGVVCAAATVFFLGLRDSEGAYHHSEAHNRAETGRAISAIPLVLASHKNVADEMNRGRDKFVADNRKAHEAAEAAWRSRQHWHMAYCFCAVLSTAGFVAGAVWPIAYIASGSHFVPASQIPQKKAKAIPAPPAQQPAGKPGP
jgi:hypothetical protein